MARFVIETSAAARMRHIAVGDRSAPLIHAGVVATCATLDADALWSARSPTDDDDLRSDRRAAYEYLPTEDGRWQRAFEAQREPAVTGLHRAVGFPDLPTAVLAAEHALTLIHDDADFEIAAQVLDLDQRWVVQRGSVA